MSASEMSTHDVMIPGEWLREGSGFKSFAKYNAVMAQVIYLDEDVTYRADRVDSFLTLFWGPNEFRPVGFKLKGFRLLFDTLKSVSSDIKEGEFVPFVKLLELAALAALASWSDISKGADTAKLQKRYAVAKKFIQDHVESRVRISDLELAA